MNIQITQAVSDGLFIIGNIYHVVSTHKFFVYATDENGDIETVYNYQFNYI